MTLEKYEAVSSRERTARKHTPHVELGRPLYVRSLHHETGSTPASTKTDVVSARRLSPVKTPHARTNKHKHTQTHKRTRTQTHTRAHTQPTHLEKVVRVESRLDRLAAELPPSEGLPALGGPLHVLELHEDLAHARHLLAVLRPRDFGAPVVNHQGYVWERYTSGTHYQQGVEARQKYYRSPPVNSTGPSTTSLKSGQARLCVAIKGHPASLT